MEVENSSDFEPMVTVVRSWSVLHERKTVVYALFRTSVFFNLSAWILQQVEVQSLFDPSIRIIPTAILDIGYPRKIESNNEMICSGFQMNSRWIAGRKY